MKRMDKQSRPYCSYVNKLGYLLETPLNPRVLVTCKVAVKNLEVRTISRKGSQSHGRSRKDRRNWENPQRLHAKLQRSTRSMRMIQSDLHSDMQESIRVRSPVASRAAPIAVSIETVMNGPKVAKFLVG